MKYQFEESGFTDKNYFPLSPNFRRNPKVFWIYHDNDCIPKWKNPGEAKLINHYLSDVIQRFSPDGIGIVTPFAEQKKILIKEIKQGFDEFYVGQILVDTLHGFIGIEQDVIFLSLVIGPSMVKPDYNYLYKFIYISANRGVKEVYIFIYRVGFQESYGVFPDLNPAYQRPIAVGLKC